MFYKLQLALVNLTLMASAPSKLGEVNCIKVK